MNRYRLYTGPTLTQHVANVLLLNGFASVFEGTEAVYFNARLDRFAAHQLLREVGLTGYRLNDLSTLGTA